MDNVIEIRRSRRSRGAFNEQWTGELVFSVHPDSLESEAASWDGAYYQFNRNYPALRAEGVKQIARDPKLNGRSLLYVYFKSVNWGFHQPNIAYFTVEAKGHSEELTRERGAAVPAPNPDPHLIRGSQWETQDIPPDNSGDMVYYRPQDGDRIIDYDATTVVTVYTAYPRSEVRWDTINDRIGKCNSNAMPKLAGADERQFKLVAAGIPKYHIWTPSDEIIPIHYVFYKHADEWPEEVEVLRMRKIGQRVPIWNYKGTSMVKKDGSDTSDVSKADTRVVINEHPVDNDNPTVTRTVNEFVDFGDLYGMVAW